MSATPATAPSHPWAGPFAPLVKVLGGLLALVALSPVATYIARIGPPVSFLTDDQVVLVSLTSGLALYGLLASTAPPATHRWARARRVSGLATVSALAVYLWLHSEFVVTLPEVNNSAVVVGYRYTPAADAVRAARPGISDTALLTEWFACDIDECYDPASTRFLNRAILASWVFFWMALSSLIWAVTARPPSDAASTGARDHREAG